MKINNVAKAILAASLVFSAPMVFADGSGVNTSLDSSEGTQGSGGVVTFQGKITEVSCNVTTDSKSKLVDLGAWAKSYFDDHDETTRRQFKINVEDCPESVTSVAVLFDGTKDAQDSTLLKVTPGADSASGVGVKLLEDDGSTQIKIGSVSKSVAPEAGGTAELAFYADYTKNGDAIKAGDASAVSNFLMVYN
ncbi:fimbrial protein [Intestinirhabdus alba]|jgi:major type 1 subunit fimbrin (pilin)|uniref:Fimbrial protein n=1 Tax=Intestinirhabdus alba TaxID=2899544 RepID=A0A6L6IIU5_9ENTR|nr:fimbrial protein [Intestinirhabdus alba]MTH45506.1 fimbrial protein [Intestinirhabdus alba]